ncbi:MAG: type VI secretion system tip protein VgrG, partial [Chromatiales bacterium]|nr:type VI secretion system tip protein VgrG [Chromatiales bacterium]
MAEFKQQSRLLAIDSPLGDDVLLLTRLEGEEHVSTLFSFDIELYSKRKHIGPEEIVGQNVTLKLMEVDDDTFMQNSYRHINGYVRSFRGEGQELQGLRCYRAEIVPWFWFLTQTSDSKIFQNKTVKEIATQIFSENGFTDYQFKVAGQHPSREYCVQYQESDFNFLSRLFEEEGIYYYFTHEAGKHTLIISDHIGGYSVCDEASVNYQQGSMSPHTVHAWRHNYQFRTGRYAQRDYDFKKPSHRLQTG